MLYCYLDHTSLYIILRTALTASYMSNSTRSILLFIFHVQHNTKYTSMASFMYSLSIVPQRIPSWQTTHCIHMYILFLFCHVCHIFHNKHRFSLYITCVRLIKFSLLQLKERKYECLVTYLRGTHWHYCEQALQASRPSCLTRLIFPDRCRHSYNEILNYEQR